MMYADLSSCERRAESYSGGVEAVGVRIKVVSYGRGYSRRFGEGNQRKSIGRGWMDRDRDDDKGNLT